MNIRSTQNRPLPQSPAKPALNSLAKMDQDLAQGVDVVNDRVFVSRFPAKDPERAAKREFAFQAVALGGFGTVAGCVFGDFSPIGAAAGLGLGVYIAYNKTLRANSGKVNITLDGQTRTTRYYGRPDNFKKTPQERRLEMLAIGSLGEKIPSHKIQGDELPNVPITAEVLEMKSQLKALSEEGKLVADFGSESRYGQPVLSKIDARVAAKLLSADRAVYAVAGQSEDIEHSLEVSAANERSTVRKSQADTYIERKFDYKLTELSPQGTDELPQGSGLPEGLFGIYKDQESCGVSIARDDQRGYGSVSSNRDYSSFRSTRVSSDDNINLGSKNRARVVSTSSVNVRDIVTMSGVLAGLVTGMNVSPGVPQAALLGGIVGGVIGRELGWLAQDRMPRFQH